MSQTKTWWEVMGDGRCKIRYMDFMVLFYFIFIIHLGLLYFIETESHYVVLAGLEPTQ